MTKWQTRQALYLLGLTGILYLFSCKSQGIIHEVVNYDKGRVFCTGLLLFINLVYVCIHPFLIVYI